MTFKISKLMAFIILQKSINSAILFNFQVKSQHLKMTSAKMHPCAINLSRFLFLLLPHV